MAEKTNKPGAAPAAPTDGVTRVEAVRRAMAELGPDAGRTDIQTFVKKHFGFEMTLDHISSSKSEVRKKLGQAQARKSPAPKAEAPKAAAPRREEKPPAGGDNGRPGGGIDLADIEAVKGLVGRVGAGSLKTLIDLLAH